MGGYCSALDTVEHPRVWYWNKDSGFVHPKDPLRPRWTNESGSPVIPFLKRMALLYPDYNFCGLMYGCPCNQARHIFAEEDHRSYVTKRIKELKEHTIFGGIMMMYGFIEGQDYTEVHRLDTAIENLIFALRSAAEDSLLPVFLGRYEENGEKKEFGKYHKWDSEVIERIKNVGRLYPHVYLTPIRPIPASCFCDDHHYTQDGYKIWSEDACAILQLTNSDFWYKK